VGTIGVNAAVWAIFLASSTFAGGASGAGGAIGALSGVAAGGAVSVAAGSARVVAAANSKAITVVVRRAGRGSDMNSVPCKFGGQGRPPIACSVRKAIRSAAMPRNTYNRSFLTRSHARCGNPAHQGAGDRDTFRDDPLAEDLHLAPSFALDAQRFAACSRR
jgi:hypothetical protein